MFRYAMAEQGLMTNPSADLDIVAIPKPPVTNNPYQLMEEIPFFLQKLRGYGGAHCNDFGFALAVSHGCPPLRTAPGHKQLLETAS
ncbi:hypothetical protein [Pseudomonas fluorescens]|uniref:hypothetical protein n=1 Tax=Pseudomonas fluorescens TaxID=294 RepID=UPI00123F5CAA|nr:hypothetical protein [Pseudomonas fluorescens]